MKKLISLIFCLLSFGCSGDSESEGDTRIRFINACPDAAFMDVFLDGGVFKEGYAYLASDNYHNIQSGSRDVRVTITNSFTTLVDGSFNFDDDQDYTLFVTGRSTDSRGILTLDDKDAPTDGRAKLRFFNAISDSSGRVDVYITEPDTSLAVALPNIENLSVREVTDYLFSQEGLYRIRVTPTNSIAVIADTGPIAFEEGDVRTAVIADTLGGGPPYGITILEEE